MIRTNCSKGKRIYDWKNLKCGYCAPSFYRTLCSSILYVSEET